MRLRWTTPATNDLYDIVQRIQNDNPAAAADVAKTLYDGCGRLRDFLVSVVTGGSKARAN